jgi:hypothetical protein
MEIQGMVIYNGKLFAGTLPGAKVYRHDGDSAWAYTGQLDHTPNVLYHRSWSSAVYKGRLYTGSFPSGHVWTLEAGKCVTDDRALEPGWRHIAAVKAGGALTLYVDGKRVGASTPFEPADFDLAERVPLLIGFGQHDNFNGMMRDLRIYRRALDGANIAALVMQK